MMKRILGVAFALTCGPALATAAPDDDGWVLNDSNAKVSHDCAKQPRVVINASKDVVTLTGPCTRVTANGHGLHVTIESADALSVNGAGIVVDVAAVGVIAVTGAQNKVTWKAGPAGKGRPRVTSSGAGNTILKAP